jgi:hypothetical protein
VWLGARSSDASSDVSAIAGVQNGLLLSVTPIDLLELAAGPSFDYLTGGASSATATSVASAGFSDVFFAAHGRVALHLGGRSDSGRRRGFTIGGDVHPTFSSGGALTFVTLGLGADWY